MATSAASLNEADTSSDMGFSDAAWLRQLPQHPVFLSAEHDHSSASGSHDIDSNDVRPTAMAVRNTDVLVAHGKSLRIASLLEVKHKSGSGSALLDSTQQTGSYKRLVSGVLDFEIERLIVNPTGKFVVVIGSHKLAIVVLPRAGALHAQAAKTSKHSISASTSSAASDVSVKAALVGPFYHHERISGRSRLADVKWHPWGDKGSSLLVMTRNGVLREYDVAADLEEPAQTVSLLPTTQPHLDGFSALNIRDKSFRARSRSRSATPAASRRNPARRSSSRIAFDQGLDDDDESWDEDLDGADDTFYTANASFQAPSSHTAVAFTVGIDPNSSSSTSQSSGQTDWTPLTIFTLCNNGDVFSLCPFMPKNALASLSFLHSLSSRVASTLAANASQGSQESMAYELQSRYVASLLKQAKHHRLEVAHRTPSERLRSSAPSIADESRNHDDLDEGAFLDDVVLIHAPQEALVPRQAQVQGPYLLAPEPHELSDRMESVATDLCFTRVTGTHGEALDVIGIASTNGKIDLCLLMQSITPRWPMCAETKPKKAFKSGRYALSDSEDEDDYVVVTPNQQSLDTEEEELPTLLVYESVDLGILDLLKGDDPILEARLKESPMRFVLDPIYTDLIYVQHIAGAHAIGIGSWAKALVASQAQSGQADTTLADDSIVSISSQPAASSGLARFLHQGHKSDVVWVVKTITETGLQANEAANSLCGLCIISDLYLCYAFLGLAQNGALVALELTLRTDDEGDVEDEASIGADHVGDGSINVDDGSASLYTSLLGDGPPFAPPELFKTFRGLPSQPQSATSAWDSSEKDELRVTPDTLRKFATTVQDLRGRIRAIVQAGNAVQSRLNLQIQEHKRQLSKLDEIARRVSSEQRGKASANTNDVESRLNNVVAKQKQLGQRSDRLLQRLIENHSPELSIYEKRWLDELERMSAQIGVGDDSTSAPSATRQITISGTRAVQQDEKPNRREKTVSGMAARIEALRYRLERIQPEMEQALQQKRHEEQISGSKTNPSKTMLGTAQLREMEAMLATEAKILLQDREKITRLNAAIRSQTGGLTHSVLYTTTRM